MISKVYADFAGQIGQFNDISGFAGKPIAAIVSDVLQYVFPLSGLLFFFFLVSGGFDLMTAAGDPKKMEAAKEKITAAVVGFFLVFTAFWIYKLIGYVLGLTK